jgi:hypothetical protein
MTAARWAEVERLYHAALEREPVDRRSFLDDACAGDDDLRQEVESLLRYQPAADGFLERPALQQAAERLAGEVTAPLADPEIPGYTIVKTLGEAIEVCTSGGDIALAQHARLRRASQRFVTGIEPPSPEELLAEADRSIDASKQPQDDRALADRVRFGVRLAVHNGRCVCGRRAQRREHLVPLQRPAV